MQHTNVLLHTMTCDISHENEAKRFIESTIKTFGGIDILINNAGISMRALFKDLDLDVLRKVMDINFYGAVYCTRFALNSLMERKGTIVGVSSIAGYRGSARQNRLLRFQICPPGLDGSLRTEMLETGVHVMWVCPGFTASIYAMQPSTRMESPRANLPWKKER